MTPEERAAVEQAVNSFLQNAVVVLVVSWWIWWLGNKVGIWNVWGGIRELREKITSIKPEPAPPPAPLQPAQPILQTPANVIAKPQNDYKPTFAIAPDVQRLAELLDVDPDIIEQVAMALARLCDADELGETAAIKVGLGISPSSTSEKYKVAKAVMATLRKQPKTEIVALEQDPGKPNREVPIRA